MPQINSAAINDHSATLSPAASNGAGHQPVTISHRRLAYLDIRVFRQLLKLGTSKERICTVLNLQAAEFDYVCTLS